MTTSDKMMITYEFLKKYGNYYIKRQLKNKGFHYSDKLYKTASRLAEYYEDMQYMIESDHGWSKEFVKLTKKYRKCCRTALKFMRRPDGE